MTTLKAGDEAPAFDLVDQHGSRVKLGEFKGSKVLVYFYPKADTPGCTAQACSVRDASGQLALLGLPVVGISPDLPEAQKAFDSRYGLGFTLLSDPDHAAAEAYGAWGEKSMYGKKVMGIVRSSFLIDENGKIIEAWYRVSPEDTVPKALAAMEAAR